MISLPWILYSIWRDTKYIEQEQLNQVTTQIKEDICIFKSLPSGRIYTPLILPPPPYEKHLL